MARNITKVEFNVVKILSKKRVCAYARVSSGKDAMLHSLSAQVSFYSEHIQKQSGFEYCGVYADEALTGTSDNRAEFQRMLADCRSGKIDMIITKSISRFARNTLTMLETVRELKTLGIDIYFEKENINTNSGDGELMLTILASFAQEESLSVSENCKWRIRNGFKDGKAYSFSIFGYTLKNGVLEIVPDEAKIVWMIFVNFLSGMGKNAIMKKLNGLGIKTKKGLDWREMSIDIILRNEKYMGDMLLQKVYTSNHLEKKKKINQGELPRYYVENSHQAIISKETFMMAQELIKRKAVKPKKNGTYPFTSKIQCENCGANHQRKTTTTGPVWICSTYNRLGKSLCYSKQIPEDILIATTNEVLNLIEFDENILNEKIKQIIVPEFNKLIYIFNDGTQAEKTWQDKSRKDSWNETNKQLARERSKRNNK